MAIELASGIRDLGHRVIVGARPGPMEELVRDRQLPFVRLPTNRSGSVRSIRETVRRERIELVHGYERSRTLQAFFSVGITGTPIVGSIMTMGIPPGLPNTIRIVVGTRQLYEDARLGRKGPVDLLEPVVNTDQDRPGTVDASGFASRYAADGAALVVLVSRLSAVMKIEGVKSMISVVERVSHDVPARLVIVGSGEAEDAVRHHVDEANQRAGRTVAVMAGRMTDPRVAYEAADVVVGQSTAVLRGMAFEKPGIVLGEEGFAEVFSEETLGHFLRVGLYGLGDDAQGGDLDRHLHELLVRKDRRAELGRYSRAAVERHFGLGVASKSLEGIYETAMRNRAPIAARLMDASSVSARLLASRVRHDDQRRQGRDRMREVVRRESETAPRPSGRAPRARAPHAD